jgi:hypothetical protein
MQFEVTDGAAVGFAQGFYTSVVGGSPIDDALTQARLSMLTEGDGSEWATPVLYTHTDETRMFDLATEAASDASPGGVEALPGGGRIVAGEVIVQVDPDLGVRLDPNDDRIVPRPRPAPVAVLPPPFPLLLGRDGEMAQALNGGPGAMLEFIAEPGFGKTALLRAIAYRAVGGAPGGLLFLRVVSRPAMDVLQFLFERLFETAVPFKPTEEQIAPWMAPIEATVVLDDVGFGPEEMAAIMRAAPHCRFVLAGPGAAPGEQVVPLRGVPVEAGITRIELAMGRTLYEVERADAARMCEALEGSPGRILGAGEWAWEQERPLSEVVAALRPRSLQG